MTMKLNEGQTLAQTEILAAQERGVQFHTLTGNAGTGKTTLMQSVVAALAGEKVLANLDEEGGPEFIRTYDDTPRRRRANGKPGLRVGVTAPTHKAVNVLEAKLRAAGLAVTCAFIGTIHSLLGLKVQGDGDKQKLKKTGKSKTHMVDVVIVDECSMIGSDLLRIITEELTRHFVLFLGDPAQLPPVGETHSATFDYQSRSHLGTIVRQAEGNPIIAASQMLRDCQDRKLVRWDWAREVSAGEFGIYHVPGQDTDDWLKPEFTSEEFRLNNDACRYLCYTNRQVAAINMKIRRWVYGDTPTPFVVGERAICRNPVMHDGNIAFSTNQEVTVQGIEEHTETFHFPALPEGSRGRAIRAHSFELMCWKLHLGEEDAQTVPAIIPRYARQYEELLQQLKNEALENTARWFERYMVQEKVGNLQHVYAMTAHTSQGSTFGRVFMDIPDMLTCGRFEPVDMLKLFYVGVTRPTHAVALVGPVPT